MIVKAETSEAFKSAIMSSNSIEPAAFMSDKKSYATYRKDLLGWSRISKAVPKHRKYQNLFRILKKNILVNMV